MYFIFGYHFCLDSEIWVTIWKMDYNFFSYNTTMVSRVFKDPNNIFSTVASAFIFQKIAWLLNVILYMKHKLWLYLSIPN